LHLNDFPKNASGKAVINVLFCCLHAQKRPFRRLIHSNNKKDMILHAQK